MTQQPETLRLADEIDFNCWPEAAAELRRLYAENKQLKSATQEPVKFLANGTRFKMAFFNDEDWEGNPTESTHVTCFEGFENELDGRWVALVAAEDDSHLKYAHPPQRSEDIQQPKAELSNLERHEQNVRNFLGEPKAAVAEQHKQEPKREWVGLTDEEIEQEFGFIDELLRDCVYRTEAKLKEKNT